MMKYKFASSGITTISGASHILQSCKKTNSHFLDCPAVELFLYYFYNYQKRFLYHWAATLTTKKIFV
ncbi:unnamed protein product [Ranitomeya imitator]|uniref:Uncharacterized protein n=1 Tax=Ranitomeya imitator TaxID=111125 RepID=A0ABN9LC67_9NEOB|nr:unnamed protein product [Ranitomeya imitator]